MVPRPIGSALHSEKQNEVIHFDYCQMGESTETVEYVLIIKEDLTIYI